MANRKALTEERNEAVERMAAILDTAKSEGRLPNQPEKEEFENLYNRVGDIDAAISMEERFTNMNEYIEAKHEEIQIDDRKQFADTIRGIVNAAGNLAYTSTPVPSSVAREIVRIATELSPVVGSVRRYNTKGTLVIPAYTDGITVAFATEFTALTSTTGAFASISLGNYLAGALCKVSKSLINNADIDVVQIVIDDMAHAIASFLENAILNGSGSVTGLSTATNVVTTASATAITADELIQLENSVRDEFLAGSMWVMNRATRGAVRTLKDGAGHYLLIQDASAPFGYTLLGYPVYCSDNVDQIATKKATVFFGNFDKGAALKFSEDINIEILREHFATEHAVGVVGWLEFDAKATNPKAIAVLKQA